MRRRSAGWVWGSKRGESGCSAGHPTPGRVKATQGSSDQDAKGASWTIRYRAESGKMHLHTRRHNTGGVSRDGIRRAVITSLGLDTDAAIVRWETDPRWLRQPVPVSPSKRERRDMAWLVGVSQGLSRAYSVESVAVENKSRYLNRDWPCPKCGAGVGQVCRYPSNYHYSKGHSERGLRG